MFPPEQTHNQPMPGEMQAEGPTKTADAEARKRWAKFRQSIESTKAYRGKLVRNWTTNIDFRRGKTYASQDDNDQVAVNLDWSYTKTKQAALFSQVPEVRVLHHPETLSIPWISTYERHLNDNLKSAGIEAAMDEVMPDCINAAGIGVVMVAHEALTVMKDLPAIDLSIFPPEIQMTAMQTGQLFGQPMPMKQVPQKAASRYVVRRISPADFLWPVDFTGSDFDNAPWLGYTGRITWEEAKNRFQLDDADKEKVTTEERTLVEKLNNDSDRLREEEDKVGFDEIFYNEYQYNSDATSFNTIHHLVFLHGKPDPVIDEPWSGQHVDPEDPTKMIGAHKKPIRVLTLAYISDEDIPPSDSAVARSQVLELNRGRTQMSKQRARSSPWNWFDVNRLDPAIQAALMRGVWNYAIPVQGDGSRILGSISQPALPQDNYHFDSIAKQDAQEMWTIGSNQLGVGGGVETKGEANVIQQNFMTKVGRERARVGSFFTGIAEVLGGLMCLFEDPASFGKDFDPTIGKRLEYSILADSTVLVDSQERLNRLNNYINTYAKSGYVVIEPILREIATLIGLDPNTVVKAPEPQVPPPPNISLRLTGADDMMNPLLLAFMLKTGQAPDPQLVEKAKELIQMSVQMTSLMTPPAGPMPPAPPPNVGEANPDASLMPTIGKRADEPSPQAGGPSPSQGPQ